jgi:DNA-binding response OmpR family regulator
LALRERQLPQAAATPPAMNKPWVLLVDDDRSVLDALGTVIESEGFELVRAADGHEAVEKFRQQPIDIVLLDLNMPVKGGWDTLERLTTINPLLPIIVITARSDAYPVAMERGVAVLMQKPLDITLLLEAMRELLAEPATKRLSRVAGHGPQTRKT